MFGHTCGGRSRTSLCMPERVGLVMVGVGGGGGGSKGNAPSFVKMRYLPTCYCISGTVTEKVGFTWNVFYVSFFKLQLSQHKEIRDFNLHLSKQEE